MSELLGVAEPLSPVERVEDMTIEEIAMALDGILAMTQETYSQAPEGLQTEQAASTEYEPFGTQLMEPTDDERPPITLDTPKAPNPTFSGRGLVKPKDDGGTGPADEAQKIVII